MLSPMLYLDYCRKPGEWLLTSTEAEKTRAAEFLRQAITSFSATGILSIAEESTDWPMVSWPTHQGDWALT